MSASFSSYSATKQGPTVAVVGAVETLVGAHIARLLARGDFTPQVGEIRGLVDQSQTQAQRPVLAFLATQGMRAVEVKSYNEVAAIEEALRGSEWMVMVPPMLGASPQACGQEAQRIVSAAKKAGIERVVLLSYVGCDAPEKKWLAAFGEAERAVAAEYGPKAMTLRLGFPAQALRLCAHGVRTKRALELPLPASAAINPVDLDDVARCIAGMIGTGSIPAQLAGKTMDMFGPGPVTAKTIAQIITDAVQPITGKPVSLNDRVSREQVASEWCLHQRRALDRSAAQNPAAMIRGITEENQMWCNSHGPFSVNAAFAGAVAELCELATEGKRLAGTNAPAVHGLHPCLNQANKSQGQNQGQGWYPVERSIRQVVAEWV